MKGICLVAGSLAIGLLTAARATPHGAAAATIEPAAIDHMIRAEWAKSNVVPAAPVDDARFIRRAYLDVTGRIPPPDAVTAFLADHSADKRSKLIDSLLASPEYATHWTSYWDNVLMGRQVRNPALDRVAWRQWLYGEFAKNVAWNRFVFDLVSAEGINSAGGDLRRAAGLMMAPDKMQAMEAPSSQTETVRLPGGRELNDPINGAVNWILKYQQAPADLSGAASKIFLGVQIQCAQCHDHKTEKWKQDDFRKFTACFMAARPVPVGQYDKGSVRRVDLREVPMAFVPRRGKQLQGRGEFLGVQPAALDGTDMGSTANRRRALATWMTAPDNPWFAQAIVNRMWAHFMGRGFVDPIDDFRESNPPVMPELLKRIADDFVANGYDTKHLIKLITSTQVYQLSAGQGKNIDADNKLWARYRLKPMGPEELMDSLVQATNLAPILERVAGGNIDALKFQIYRQFTFLFDTDEESEQKDFEGTIPQALMLLNGNLTNRGASPIPGTALAQAMQMPTDAQRIEALYLRTLSRRPTSSELQKWTAFVTAPREVVLTDTPAGDQARQRMNFKPGNQRRGPGPDPLNRLAMNRRFEGPQTAQRQAYEDLFWALLNSSEFIFNH